MRIGVVCSGGDSPGMNAAIRAAVLRGVDWHGFDMVGFSAGWRGFLDNKWVHLNRQAVRGIAPQGGVILGTSRVNPFTSVDGEPEDYDRIRTRMRMYGLDGFMLIGGEGTHTVSGMLHRNGIPVIGLPKTIDNDIYGTDACFGFDTAVGVATEAIDRLRTTGESHRRCMVLEVMGRNAGWIALHAGIAGGAHAILIPERPESLDQVASWVKHVHDRGRSALVVVAEGFALEQGEQVLSGKRDRFGRELLGGVGESLATLIENATGITARATVLGHVQRGGSPSAFDRVLAARTGIAAADAAADGQWGHLAVLQGDAIALAPFATVTGKTRTVPTERYDAVRVTFG